MTSGRRALVPLFLLLFAVLIAGCDDASKPSDRVAFPIAPLTRLDTGETEDFMRYRGRTIVVNVWATWCAPCRREMPSLQRLSQVVDSDAYVVVGISVDKEPAVAREYLQEAGVTFVNYVDPTQKVTKGHLDVRVLPETIVVGTDGTILERLVGAREWDSPEMATALERLRRRAAGG